MLAIENGIDKVRINPGNIGRREKVEAVVKACKEREFLFESVSMRVRWRTICWRNTAIQQPEAMVESALFHIGILEELDFHDIIVSLKASDVPMAIEAYSKAAEKIAIRFIWASPKPERFSPERSRARPASALCSRGIGNTVRISLSAILLRK